MPRYFFHCMDGHVDLDEDGTELADDDAARLEATTLAGSILRTEPEHLQGGKALRIEVANASGDLLFTVVTISIDAPAVAAVKP